MVIQQFAGLALSALLVVGGVSGAHLHCLLASGHGESHPSCADHGSTHGDTSDVPDATMAHLHGAAAATQAPTPSPCASGGLSAHCLDAPMVPVAAIWSKDLARMAAATPTPVQLVALRPAPRSSMMPPPTPFDGSAGRNSYLRFGRLLI